MTSRQRGYLRNGNWPGMSLIMHFLHVQWIAMKKNAHFAEPERELCHYQNNSSELTYHEWAYHELTYQDKNQWLGEQPVWWGHYPRYSKSGLTGCKLHHLTIPALEGPKSISTWSISFYMVYWNRQTRMRNLWLSWRTSFEIIARSLSSTPVHACSSSFTKGQYFHIAL